MNVDTSMDDGYILIIFFTVLKIYDQENGYHKNLKS